MHHRVTTYGIGAMIGGGILVLSATLVDLGWMLEQPTLARLGNVLSVLAGIGLWCVPLGLRASGVARNGILAHLGAACLLVGTTIVSLVDVPTIIDPTDVRAGTAFGPLGLIVLSVGYGLWFVAMRRAQRIRGWGTWIVFVAGVWFFVSFPLIQLPLFVIPNGRPSFMVLGGVYGVLQLLIGFMLYERAARRALVRQYVSSVIRHAVLDRDIRP